MSEKSFSLSPGKYRRRKDFLPEILKDWYGEEIGTIEVCSYLQSPIPFETAVKELMDRTLTPDSFLVMKLMEEWENIAGPEIAKFAKPANIKNKTLMIEVTNSAWLMELERFGKKMLLDKIKSNFDGKFCLDIRFIPSG